MNVGMYCLSDEEDFHSAGSSPAVSKHHELWFYDSDIGKGGFGVVKLYKHKLTGAKLVLKESRQSNLPDKLFERWTLEMEIVKRLNHENIVKAQDLPAGLILNHHGNVPCICMEYCDGGDLRKMLSDPQNCCGLGEEDIRQICSDINSGIRFLHYEKIIHRDLKPENILRKIVDERVVYKLTDFGYAKSYDISSACESMVGTMQYVAPEVLRGLQYHSSVDLWSFGVVVFECISGKRPFLHSGPSMNTAWVDCVTKKAKNVIYIYNAKDPADDTVKPQYSDQLPAAHRLSKPLEGLMVKWLRRVLQYNPDNRGGKTTVEEEAPCLLQMESILTTKVMNIVSTTSGDIHSCTVSPQTTIRDLKVHIEQVTGLLTEEQYMLRPDGTLPLDFDLASTCIQEESNVGELYVFTISLMPSFKLIHDNNPNVERLSSYGDEQIKTSDERRTIFSHVYHHIRSHHAFFTRLHHAHKAILHQIQIQKTLVHRGENDLLTSYSVASNLVSLIGNMLSADQSKLQGISADIRERVTTTWSVMDTTLEGHKATLAQLTNSIADARKEVETYLRLANELITQHEDIGQQFVQYQKTFVTRARNIYRDIKSGINKESSHGRMQDVLLQALNASATLIERLNGVSFCQEYVALAHMIQTIESNKERVEALQSEVSMLIENHSSELWGVVNIQASSVSSWSNTSSPLASANRRLPETVYEDSKEPGVLSRYSHSRLVRQDSEGQANSLLSENRQLLDRLNSLNCYSKVHVSVSTPVLRRQPMYDIDPTASLPATSGGAFN